MRLISSLEISQNTGFVSIVVFTQQWQVVCKEFPCYLSDTEAPLAMGCVVYFSHVISKNIKLTFWRQNSPLEKCGRVKGFGVCGYGKWERSYLGRGLKQGSEKTITRWWLEWSWSLLCKNNSSGLIHTLSSYSVLTLLKLFWYKVVGLGTIKYVFDTFAVDQPLSKCGPRTHGCPWGLSRVPMRSFFF